MVMDIVCPEWISIGGQGLYQFHFFFFLLLYVSDYLVNAI